MPAGRIETILQRIESFEQLPGPAALMELLELPAGG
jgi:hypothetical protein